MPMRFGAALRSMRRERGVTVAVLGSRLHLSCSYVSDVERGNRRPLGPKHIKDVGAVLGLSSVEMQRLHVAAATDRECFLIPVPKGTDAATLQFLYDLQRALSDQPTFRKLRRLVRDLV